MPCVVCDIDGTPIDHAHAHAHAKLIIAAHWTVPADVRVRRRSRKPASSSRAGKALS
jgi:hypothetical protein